MEQFSHQKSDLSFYPLQFQTVEDGLSHLCVTMTASIITPPTLPLVIGTGPSMSG